MEKSKKISIGIISLVLIATLTLVVITLFGKSSYVSGKTYSYTSSNRDYETVEEIVLDGQKKDDKWANIKPYVRKTSAENRDTKKYEVFESQIKECQAEISTYFGEEGLFIHATTDEPVVNLTTFNPFNSTAFDFYISSQESLTRMDQLFNFCVNANGVAKLRVRSIDNTTGKEAWMSRPLIGVKIYVSVNEKGYSLEAYIPWTTINMEKPEYLQLATALSRRIDETYESPRIWEMFDYYTESINLTNSATFPLFDKNGYVEFAEGENFARIHNNLINLSKDKGTNPQVSTLNRRTATAFLKQDSAKDVYWETAVSIQDFNYMDDPRVGILLRGDKAEDGSYSQVYLLFQLDKKYEGEGYIIKNLLVLPSTNEANDWDNQQTFVLNSAVKNSKFKLGIMKQGSKFSFYLDDVLLCERTNVANFKADTKVKCGITTWFVGATFSDYKVATSGLNAIKESKTQGFAAEEKYKSIAFDLLTQKDGYIWGYSNKTNHSTVNFNKNITKNFQVSTQISDLTSYKEATDSRQGIMLTKDLTGGKYRRMFVSLVGGKENNFSNLQVYVFDNDEMGENWSGMTKVVAVGIGKRKGGELKLFVLDNHAKVYLDGKFISDIDLATYGMENPDRVGLSSWKGTAKFTNSNLIIDATEVSTITTDKNVTRSVLSLLDEAATDFYAETKIQTASTSTSMWPRAGLRVTNEAGQNIDFFLAFNKEKTLQNVIAIPVDTSDVDNGTRMTYTIDSALKDVENGIRLGVGKIGNTLYFYVNDVLQGTKTYEGFGASDKATVNLYAKGVESTFSKYSAVAGVTAALAEMNTKDDVFVADDAMNKISYDLLNEADSKDAKVTINETQAWKSSSIINWNKVSASKFYTETTVELTKENSNGKAVGIVLTDGDNRFSVMLRGNAAGKLTFDSLTGITWTKDGDCSDKANRVFNMAVGTLSGKQKLGLYRDGNLLYVLLNNKLITTYDISSAANPITGDTMVGLTTWKAGATFTDYIMKAGDNAPELNVIDNLPLTSENLANWTWNGKYDSKENTYTLNIDKSDATKSTQVLALNETPATDLYVETTMKVNEGSTKGYPRVGLRFVNEDNQKIDFVITLKKETTPGYDNVWVVVIKPDGSDGTTVKYKNNGFIPNNIADFATQMTGSGVKFGVAKVNGNFYFCINDMLAGQIPNDTDFDTSKAVTAYLYSKYTETKFTKCAVKGVPTIITPELSEDITGWDTNGTYDAKDNVITVEKVISNENAGTMTMKLNSTPKMDLYAETTMKVKSVNIGAWPRVGLRFVNENNQKIDFVVTLTKATTPTYDNVYAVTLKPNGGDGTIVKYKNNGFVPNNFPNFATQLKEEGVKFSVAKSNEKFYFYINDMFAGSVSGDANFDASKKVTAYLYSKNTETLFSNYCAKVTWVSDSVGSSTEYKKNIGTLSAKGEVDLTVKTSSVNKSSQPKVGVQLSDGTNTFNYMIQFKKQDSMAIDSLMTTYSNSYVDPANNKVGYRGYTSQNANVLTALKGSGVQLRIVRAGSNMKLYFGNTEIANLDITNYGFSESGDLSVFLYNRNAQTRFTDYIVN